MQRTFFVLYVLATAFVMPSPAHATSVEHTIRKQAELRECIRSADDVIVIYDLVLGECKAGYVSVGTVTWHRYFEVAFINRRGKKLKVEPRPANEPVHIAGKRVKQKVCTTKDDTNGEISSLFWIIEPDTTPNCDDVPRKAWFFRFTSTSGNEPKLVEVGLAAETYRVKLDKLTPNGKENVEWVVRHAIMPGLQSDRQRLVSKY